MPLKCYGFVAGILGVCAFLSGPCAQPAAGQDSFPATAGGQSSAWDLMKRGLYRDAIRLLQKEIEAPANASRTQPANPGDASAIGKKYLMLGECYYMLGQYPDARSCLAKARPSLSATGDLAVADYRIACVAYRLGEHNVAVEKIDAFEKQHPSEAHLRSLLVFKMKILAGKGPDAQKDLEAVHARLTADRKGSDSTTALLADQMLTEFYVSTGQSAKASSRYVSTLHNCRNIIAQCARENRAVPASVEQAHDNAAIQLGTLWLSEGQSAEAVKYLQNVRYDPELKVRAAVLLAEVAYQQQDYDKAIGHLNKSGPADGTLAGPLKSDVYLLLGFCQKNRQNGDFQKAVEYLQTVELTAKGYFQAQAGLGDLYRARPPRRKADAWLTG